MRWPWWSPVALGLLIVTTLWLAWWLMLPVLAVVGFVSWRQDRREWAAVEEMERTRRELRRGLG